MRELIRSLDRKGISDRIRNNRLTPEDRKRFMMPPCQAV